MKPAPRLRFTRRQEGSVLVVELAGDLVLNHESNLLKQEVTEVLDAAHKQILLNLGQVRYLDSMGAGMLVVVLNLTQAYEAQLKMCCLPPFVQQVLHRLQVTKHLEIYPSEAEALAAFTLTAL